MDFGHGYRDLSLLDLLTKMPDPEQQFLELIDKAIADNPLLVMPADEDQLKRLADLLELDAVW